MPRPRLAVIVVITPWILAACGNDSASSSTGAATAAKTAPPPATATAAPKPTPAPAATTAAPAAGACNFSGTWTGNYPPGPYPFSGTPFEFTFNADGTGLTHSQRADQEFAWKVEGGVFNIHGIKVEKGGRFSCSKDEVGKWSYTFTPDCGSVTFKLKEDPCKGRAKTMDGASMKRK